MTRYLCSPPAPLRLPTSEVIDLCSKALQARINRKWSRGLGIGRSEIIHGPSLRPEPYLPYAHVKVYDELSKLIGRTISVRGTVYEDREMYEGASHVPRRSIWDTMRELRRVDRPRVIQAVPKKFRLTAQGIVTRVEKETSITSSWVYKVYFIRYGHEYHFFVPVYNWQKLKIS